jgi:hypothetical protein
MYFKQKLNVGLFRQYNFEKNLKTNRLHFLNIKLKIN